MFRDDFEFVDGAAPSHLGHAPEKSDSRPIEVAVAETVPSALSWSAEAEKELKKIPFFVRGKARRNTEAYAAEKSIPVITVEALYDAKAHFGR
jgi:light-independent protochlorophyllide reductase subunit B